MSENPELLRINIYAVAQKLGKRWSKNLRHWVKNAYIIYITLKKTPLFSCILPTKYHPVSGVISKNSSLNVLCITQETDSVIEKRPALNVHFFHFLSTVAKTKIS